MGVFYVWLDCAYKELFPGFALRAAFMILSSIRADEGYYVGTSGVKYMLREDLEP